MHPIRGILALLTLVGVERAVHAELPRPEVMAAQTDKHLKTAWDRAGVEPATLADDTEFLRRVYLDLTGRIPRASEVRTFLADKDADKRRKVVDRLLDDPLHHAHFARLWRDLLASSGNNPRPANTAALEEWLRGRFRANAPFDRLVRELLTAAPTPRPKPGQRAGAADLGPIAFYQANERKPELLAASTSRLFLGVRLECAQCHNHPFARWKREQFWQFAAFFTGLNERTEGKAEVPVIVLADTKRTVAAQYLDGKTPTVDETGPRAALAGWMTGPDNPYFARAAVNRLWAHFFGFGLVDPPDDFTEENAPTHPEILNELAQAFVRSGHDQRFIIRAITATRAYQLTSAASHPTQADPRQFARMSIKGLTAEQLFDSLALAVGYTEGTQAGPATALTVASPRGQFLARFGGPGRATEARTSVLQALMLMNGQFTGDATGPAGKTLSAVAEAPFLDTRGQIEALYLATLGRLPRTEESDRLVKFVEAGGRTKDARTALADVFWALLNSTEFGVNH